MLSEMHEKLSRAVKLYDQILTQQVSQPRWRTTSLGAQSHQAYTATTVAPNGYAGQWSPQTSPSHLHYRPFGEPEAAEQVTSPAIQTSSLPVDQPQYPLPYQPQHALYNAGPPQFTSVPVSIPPRIPSSYLPSSSLQSTPTAKLPQSRPQPPSLQWQPTVPAAGPNLVRHNTVAYNSSPPAAISPSYQHLGRSNTAIGASAPQRSLQHYQPSVQNAARPPSNPVDLPQFPSVPTSMPELTTYSMHTSPISSGFEHNEERKEALLIDL